MGYTRKNSTYWGQVSEKGALFLKKLNELNFLRRGQTIFILEIFQSNLSQDKVFFTAVLISNLR